MYAPQILLKKPITIPFKGFQNAIQLKWLVSHKKVLLAPLQIYGGHTCKLLNSRQNMPPVRENFNCVLGVEAWPMLLENRLKTSHKILIL